MFTTMKLILPYGIALITFTKANLYKQFRPTLQLTEIEPMLFDQVLLFFFSV
jgi:hypothetical protein